MRVLHVVLTLEVGGAEANLYNLLRYLRQADWAREHAFEVCVMAREGPFGRDLRGLVPMHLFGLSKYDARAVPKLAHLVRQGKYDIVHVHLFPELYYTAAVSLLDRGPAYVLSEHGVWNRRRRYRWLRPLESWVYSRYDHITNVGYSVEQSLLAWLPSTRGRTSVLYNCVPLEAFDVARERVQDVRRALDIRPEQFVVLFVGRLMAAKGVDVLLEALNQTSGDVVGVIAGYGPLETELRQKAQELGLGERARFLGMRRDVPDLMCAADCLAMPSRWEGLPMVLIESMAAGLPVIGTPAGEIQHVLQHRVNGLLIPMDDAAELAGAISLLQNDATLRRALARAARLTSNQFSVESIAHQLLDLYENLLQTRKSPHA